MYKQIYGMLGLAARARKLRSGEFSTEKSVKEGRARLVIVAEDASENTKKLFRNICAYRELPMVIFGTKDSLGHAIGVAFRASISVEDEGFASQLIKLLNGGTVNEFR